jgi:NADP-dependent 3-hydroxy acid dehydrogenase YdfG
VTVLIDEPRWWHSGQKWCHLVSDSSYDELHEFAHANGIPRRGFQGDHYDIPDEFRSQMIDGGATVVESRELVRRLRAAGLRLSPAARRARRSPERRPLALVTGATRGIGRAIAERLATSHDLVLLGRDDAALAEVAAAIDGARTVAVELTEEADVAAVVDGIDRLDLLVHGAGIAELGTVADLTTAAWRETLDVNVVAVAALTRVLLPALRATGGHVVCVNSGAGLTAKPNWGSYAASKFAMRAFADSLRAEEASLRVTTIFPGRTATAMQRGVRAAEGESYDEDDYLRPESVAAAVAYAVTAGDDAHVTELSIRPR